VSSRLLESIRLLGNTNIIEKTSVSHTVNGDHAFFHPSKTAKNDKGYIITILHVDILSFLTRCSNITFIIFAVLDG